MAKNPHPSGRPIRTRHVVPRPIFNYGADPEAPYAVVRLRSRPKPMTDAIAYKEQPSFDDDDFVPFGFSKIRGEI